MGTFGGKKSPAIDVKSAWAHQVLCSMNFVYFIAQRWTVTQNYIPVAYTVISQVYTLFPYQIHNLYYF